MDYSGFHIHSRKCIVLPSIHNNRLWWGQGEEIVLWDPSSPDFNWEPLGLSWDGSNGTQHHLPVVDAFVNQSKIHCVHLENITIQEEGISDSVFPIDKCFPYLNLFRRPYGELFAKGSFVEKDQENTQTIAGISTEFYMDSFNITEEGNTQIKQPNAGYWSSPHLLGDRNWLWQWGIAPKNMHRYSFASILEDECLEMTFFGTQTTIWNKNTQDLETALLFALPVRWVFDSPEAHPFTGCICAQANAYCPCRMSARRYTGVDGFASHFSHGRNAFINGQIIYGNVRVLLFLFSFVFSPLFLVLHSNTFSKMY